MIKEGVLARRSGERFSSTCTLSDAVVVEALGDLSNCPASDAEPTMFTSDTSSAAATDEACIGAPQGR